MNYSFGVEAVYKAQRLSRDLNESVWGHRFYVLLEDLLQNQSWKDYETEAFGRSCSFDDLHEFLTHADGLAWPGVTEVLRMMRIVADFKGETKEANPDHERSVQQWAKDVLKLLDDSGVRELGASAAAAQPLAPVKIGIEGGKAGPGRGNKTVADSHGLRPSSQLSSDSQERILRRLARDAPEVLERVKAGEFKSARAAAIEAGIIKPVPTVRLVDDLNKVAASITKHLTNDQRIQLAELLLPDA